METWIRQLNQLIDSFYKSRFFIENKALKLFILLNIIILSLSSGMNYANAIVNKYISEDFLPHLWKAIKTQQIEKKVQKHLSNVVGKHMFLSLIDSTISNTIVKKKKNQSRIQQAVQDLKHKQQIKIPTKKGNKAASTIIKLEHNSLSDRSQQGEYLQQSHPRSSSLVKLNQEQQEDSQQLRNIRLIKARMRKYEDLIAKRGELNQIRKKQIGRKKMSHHSQCTYHTYDYQTNIVQMQLKAIDNFKSHQSEASLLQNIKKKLDQQIEDEAIKKKMEEIEEKRNLSHSKIPHHKIKAVNPQKASKQKAKQQNISQIIDPKLKPNYKFDLSNILSLTNNIQKYIEEGVKLVTHQQKIIEKSKNEKGEKYKIKRETKIHQKNNTKTKQKTNTSQSIIYSLQNKLNSISVLANRSLVDQEYEQYKSQQLNREIDLSKLSEYLHPRTISVQNYYGDSTPNKYDFKLPEIKFLKNVSRTNEKKRITTQKMIKGLDSIEIDQKVSRMLSPKLDLRQSYKRPAIFSALDYNKKTESSIEQSRPSLQFKEPREKKTFIRQYFNNYGKQFKMKREILDF